MNQQYTIAESFTNKTLVITGGTGSFGSTVLKHFIQSDLGEIRILSRDEKKARYHAAYAAGKIS